MNILCGGDNCSRSLVIGAAFGATPSATIPEDWIAKMKPELWAEIEENAEKVARSNA